MTELQQDKEAHKLKRIQQFPDIIEVAKCIEHREFD